MGLINGLFNDDEPALGKLVYETPEFRYYTNDMTRMYEKRMREYDESGMAPVETFRVFVTESRINGYTAYVAFDKKGQPFMDWTNPSEFDFKMSCYRMDLKEDADIVNMAKAKAKEKRKGKKGKKGAKPPRDQ